ncbi:hypothetical protein CPB84DRAFT_286538 [Gymnopilus junonius]|uniref:Uncharacterized protein n=1 Tax=Gymnopilus junonius TaxID=109634 RepID=A0A9P5NB80_GYMJU|nr:hypothetical protein CPB84DRAFT_286538 [Gymnopilus junonius]
MNRFECKSRLNIPYYDVALPPEAAIMIREDLEWTSPGGMAKKVMAAYPTVTSAQVHKAWTTMSKTLWKRDPEQLPSIKVLLKEYRDEVDMLEITAAEGIEQVAWVMKKIAEPLRGKIVEIGIDATCKNWIYLKISPADQT